MTTRRRYKRVRTRGMGAQVIRGNELTLAPVENLSASGAFLRTAHHFDVGASVDLTLVRPGLSPPLRVPARVANVRDVPGLPAGVGLEFVRMTPELERQVQTILAELGVTQPMEGEDAASPDRPGPPVSSPTAVFGSIDLVESDIEPDVTLPVPPPPPPVTATPTMNGEVNSRLISEVRSLLQDFDRPADEPPREGFSAISDDAALELHVDKSARHRRKHPRVRARGVAAQVRADDGVTTATVEDLSAAGAFLRTAHTYPIGASVELTLVRPGMKRAIHVSAKVANVRSGRGKPAGVGVHFESLRAEAEDRLKAILHDLGLLDPFQPDVPPETDEPKPEAKAWAPAPEPPPVDVYRPVGAHAVEQVDVSVPSAGHYVDLRRQQPPKSRSLPPPVSPHLATPPPERYHFNGAPPVATPEPASAVAAAVAAPPPPAMHVLGGALPPLGGGVDVAAYAPTVARPRNVPAGPPSPGSPQGGAEQVPPDVVQRMMVQIRGVLMELGEAQAKVHSQERELEALRLEVERLRAELRITRGK